MIKHLVKYRSLVAAVFMLMPLLFWFSYSELWQLSGENKNTTAQDYCEIVIVTKVEAGSTAASHLVKLEVEKTFCPNSFGEINLNGISFENRVITHLKTPQRTTQIYLYNRTFLI